MLQLSDHLYCFTDTCHVYVLREGVEAVLVDFGAGDVLDALAGIGVQRATDVLMTHHHRDQGQGLNRAVAAGARVWVPHTEQDLFARVDAHWQGRALYNNYNVRQDRFSLLEPVAVAGTLRDYETRHFSGCDVTVIPTPGHTTGSISLLTEVDGRRVAFTGDLIAAPGRVWSLAATQWTYNGGEGLPYTALSALDLRDRQPDLLLPSHGEPMEDVAAAVEPLVERLAELMRLRGQNPRLFHFRDRPYAAITPHLLRNRTSTANSYVLLSESGKALVIDFGYDFMAGQAAGDDRASRRPWLYTLPMLKRDFGVTGVDVALPTHYHDDHVAGFNLLRDVEGTQVWAAASFADILERPSAYELPCLWYDPIPVDRRLPVGEPFRWEEYLITQYPLPGHTRYAVAIAFEADGKRVLATGDQYQGDDGGELNYVYQNRFCEGDYRTAAELYRSLDPDLIISGHWEPLWVRPGYLDRLVEQGAVLERLHRELLPAEPNLGAEGFIARITPYQAQARGGEPVEFVVEVRNPFGREAEMEVRVVAPEGWVTSPPTDLTPDPCLSRRQEPYSPLPCRERGRGGRYAFTVTPPDGLTVHRARIAVDVTVSGQRFGQQAEALVTVQQFQI